MLGTSLFGFPGVFVVTDIRIYTYSSGSDDLPEDQRAIARFKMKMPSRSKNKPVLVWDWHPVLITAVIQAEAREKAQAWFDAQLEAERKKQENAEKRVAAMRAAREAKS